MLRFCQCPPAVSTCCTHALNKQENNDGALTLGAIPAYSTKLTPVFKHRKSAKAVTMSTYADESWIFFAYTINKAGWWEQLI